MTLLGQPEAITIDNGTELACNHFDQWAYRRAIQLDFITPGGPVENGIIESFNGRLRDECLNVHWFESLTDVRAELAAWQAEYNEARPHSSLGDRAPAEYIAKLLGIAAVRGRQRAEALT